MTYWKLEAEGVQSVTDSGLCQMYIYSLCVCVCARMCVCVRVHVCACVCVLLVQCDAFDAQMGL